MQQRDDVDVERDGAAADGEIQEYGSTFAEKMNSYDDAMWVKVQRLMGAVIGLVGGLAMFAFPNTETFGSYRLIIVAVLFFLGPRFIESQAERKMPLVQIAMIAAFAVCLVAFVVYMLATGKFSA